MLYRYVFPFAALLSPFLSLTAGAKPLETMVPANTSAILETPALPVLAERFQEKVAPGFVDQKLREAWKKFWDGQWKRDLHDRLGMQPTDLLVKYPKGLAFVTGDLHALLQESQKGPVPDPDAYRMALCCDAGSKKDEYASALRNFLEAGVEETESQELSLIKEQHHGYSFLVLAVDTEITRKSNSKGFYFAWIDTWLFVTPSATYVKNLIAVSEGAPSLESNTGYRDAKAQLNWKQDQPHLFLDAAKLLKLWVSAVLGPNPGTSPTANNKKKQERTEEIFKCLLGDVKTISVKLQLGEKRIESQGFISRDPEKEPGLLQLAGSREGLQFPRWVWPGSESYMTLVLNNTFLSEYVPKLLTQIYTASFGPSQAGMWRQQFSAFIGLDLEKDILASVGERLTVITKTQSTGGTDQEPDSVELGLDFSGGLFALSLSREKPWKDLLEKIAAMASGGIKQVEYLGNKVFVSAAPGAASQDAFAMTVAKGNLLLGERNNVERVLRRFGKDVDRLTEDNEYQKIYQSIGKPNAALAYQSGKSSSGTLPLLQSMVGAQLQEALRAELTFLPEQSRKEFANTFSDFMEELSKPERFKKFQVSNMSALKWEPEGLRYKSLGLCDKEQGAD